MPILTRCGIDSEKNNTEVRETMKILITGANGMLAQSVRARFAAQNELVLAGSRELDITNAELVMQKVSEIKPDLLINCAAYTAVDRAESEEDLAYKVNADGPENLAKACAKTGTLLVHISTDYVFGGGKPLSEEYQEDDPKEPQSAYGRTKLAGEEKVVRSGCKFYIFRIAWLYGEGPNFVRTMLKLAEGREKVSVVNDQYGSPTYAEDLVTIIEQALDKKIPYGIYNATNLGFTNWADFARKIYKLASVNCEVEGINSEEYEKQARARAGADYKVAKRPRNSKMSKQKLLNAGIKIPDWEDGLRRYLTQENNASSNEK